MNKWRSAISGTEGRDLYAEAVESVVRNDNCSGCGACALINPNYAMKLDDQGYNRPIKIGAEALGGRELEERVGDLQASCPGIRVVAPNRVSPGPYAAVGPVVSSWEAWSTDADLRFLGSSGGTLSALSSWLLSSGRATRVIGAQSVPRAPSRTQSVTIMNASQAAEIAGSRYGPVSNAAIPLALDHGTALVGKPCEVSAIRQLSKARRLDPPILLSFFCAGVPSQRSTDALIETLGIKAGTPLSSMRYRGHGWPGNFVAEDTSGNSVSTSYDESWGKSLGPSVQDRCKICPDGMGESADIVAGDFWRTDSRGYPTFDNGAGISALIARTPRGHALIMEAIAGGVIHAVPLSIDRIAAVQPLQVSRRQTLLGRLAGRIAAGRKVPRYIGFGLIPQSLRNPLASLRYAHGAFRRAVRSPAMDDRSDQGR